MLSAPTFPKLTPSNVLLSPPSAAPSAPPKASDRVACVFLHSLCAYLHHRALFSDLQAGRARPRFFRWTRTRQMLSRLRLSSV